MGVPSVFRFAVRLLLVTVCIMCFVGTLQAYQIVKSDTLQLTEQKVRGWIKIRIATAKLQNRMKANASEYENVVQAFFAKRKELLHSQGWTVDEFETVEQQINAAASAMDMAEDLDGSLAEHENQVAEIKSNEYYTEKQKAQMIAAMNQVREQQRSRFIEPTKPDWPAVKPYRSTLQELTDWLAGNISDPPKVK